MMIESFKIYSLLLAVLVICLLARNEPNFLENHLDKVAVEMFQESEGGL